MTEIRRELDKIDSRSVSPTISPTTAVAASHHAAQEEPDDQMGPRGDHHGRRPGSYVPPPARGTRDPPNPNPVGRLSDEIFCGVY
jgi:hypothetical protein